MPTSAIAKAARKSGERIAGWDESVVAAEEMASLPALALTRDP
jgi:hypothetical protein